MTFRIQFTEQAAAARDALEADRRALLLRGLENLARNPRRTLGTAPIGDNEDYRKAMAAPGMMIEYVIVREALVVVVLELFDQSHYLTEEDPAA